MIQSVFRFLAAALLTVGIAFAQARAIPSAMPTSVKAGYQVTKAGLVIGTIEETFARDGNRYRIVSQTRTAGPLKIFLNDRLTVTSEGLIGAAGLEPEVFESRRERNPARNVRAVFDWAGRQIVSTHDNRTENFDLPAGTLDRISAFYQFMFVAPRGDSVTTWMSQGKKAEQYRYLKRGDDRFVLGNEQLSTVHYVRESVPGDPKAELWLARDRHNLPVRMIFEDSNGMTLEQTLVSLVVQ
ncbi:MAG TPA: DUF3108 domain-containing protein [Usitatibacteraceae bacterium]|nr:DUF3108 domain-containing protein [Usitatibacteraceae bacterium]